MEHRSSPGIARRPDNAQAADAGEDAARDRHQAAFSAQGAAAVRRASPAASSSPASRTPSRAPALCEADQRIVTDRLIGKIAVLQRFPQHFPPGRNAIQDAERQAAKAAPRLYDSLNESLGDGDSAEPAGPQQQIGGMMALRAVCQNGRRTPAMLAKEAQQALDAFLEDPSPAKAQGIYPAMQHSRLLGNRVERNPLELGYDLVQQTTERQQAKQAEWQSVADELRTALERGGDAGTIEKLGQKLHAAGLDTATLVFVLAATNENGTPGLHWALQDGHAAAVTAYLALVRSFNLEQEDAVALVEAKRADGVPGAFMALQNGRAAAFTAYATGIRPFGFPPQTNERLIEARDYRGISGAHFALAKGHASTYTAFVQALPPFGFPPQTNERMIEARDDRGIPGAYFALADGRTQAVAAVGQAACLPAFGFGQATKRRLFAPDWHSLPGIHEAAMRQRRDAVLAWAKILRAQLAPAERQIVFSAGWGQDLAVHFLDLRRDFGASPATTDRFVAWARELGLQKIAAAGLPASRSAAPQPPPGATAEDKADSIAALGQLGFSGDDAKFLFDRGPAQPVPLLAGLAITGKADAITLAIEAFALQELGPDAGAAFLAARTPDGQTIWQHAIEHRDGPLAAALLTGMKTLGLAPRHDPVVMGSMAR